MNVKHQDIDTLHAELISGYKNGGFRIYDISNPALPRKLYFQPNGGMRVHGFDFDGKYAYVSAEMAGFKGNILVIYSLAIPEIPKEVSCWWMPGQETKETQNRAGERPLAAPCAQKRQYALGSLLTFRCLGN